MSPYLICLILSVGFVILPPVITFVEWLVGKCMGYNWKRVSVNRMLVYSICFLVAVWALRYAVGLYHLTETNNHNLTRFEEFCGSIVHALQTFSMDADYEAYLENSKQMIGFMTNESVVWRNAMGAYASLLNVVAPVLGGALIFEIIANIFPRFCLYMSSLLFWKHKYYFSELNEGAIALVKSIREENRKKAFSFIRRPIIVFTDVYVDKHEEKDSELLRTAKMLGAICVRDDLAHVPKRRHWVGEKWFFLVDVNEAANIQALVDLSDEYNYRFLKGSTVCLFVEGDSYANVESRIRDKLKNQKNFKEKDLPTIVPIQYYRNLVSNLLVEIPLYEPLVASEQDRMRSSAAEIEEKCFEPCESSDPRDLTVTILGNGIIGTEALLSSYCFGQMLGVRLNINVVSKDKAEDFYSKLNYINPEILESTKEKSDVLVCAKNKHNSPYATVSYCEFDARSGGFWGRSPKEHETDLTGEEEKRADATETWFDKMLETDYFIIALGSDKDNLDVATKLYTRLGEAFLEKRMNKNCVIAYVIYDSDLCEALNNDCLRSLNNDKSSNIYMRAFGSLREVYSYSNIFMSDHGAHAEETGEAYNVGKIQAEALRSVKRKRGYGDDYTLWANLSRAMHLKYKVFSLGWIHTSVFDHGEKACDAHKKQVEEACLRYKLIATGHTKGIDQIYVEQMQKASDALSWLEHRRWNAFTRVKGFRSTGAFEDYYAISPDKHKQMSLKLHPCLVESDIVQPMVDKSEILKGGDRLDEFSIKIFELKKGLAEEKKKERYDLALEITNLIECEFALDRSIRDFTESLENADTYYAYLEGLTKDEDRRKALIKALRKQMPSSPERKAKTTAFINTLSELKKSDLLTQNGLWQNYKEYDYPNHDFEQQSTLEKVAAETSLSENGLRRLCKNERINFFESNGTYYIPESQRNELKKKYPPRKKV